MLVLLMLLLVRTRGDGIPHGDPGSTYTINVMQNELSLDATLGLDPGTWAKLAVSASHGSVAKAMGILIPAMRAATDAPSGSRGSARNALDLSALQAILADSHFLDTTTGRAVTGASSFKVPLVPAYTRGWGSMFIAVALLEQDRSTSKSGLKLESKLYDGGSGKATTLTTFAKQRKHIYLKKTAKLRHVERKEYYRAIKEQARVYGMFNAALEAAEKLGLLENPRNTAAMKLDVDATYMFGLIYQLSLNWPHMMKMLASVRSRDILQWMNGHCSTHTSTSTLGVDAAASAGDGLLATLEDKNRITVDFIKAFHVQCAQHQGMLVKAARQHTAAIAAGVLQPGEDTGATNEAAAFGRIEMLDLALQHETRPTEIVRDGRRWTPLHIAAVAGWPQMMSPLIKHGFDPNHPSGGGLSAVDIACRQHWSSAEMAEAFGNELAAKCKASAPPPPPASRFVCSRVRPTIR